MVPLYLDLEWEKLLKEYETLTGSKQNSDGVEVPSLADYCFSQGGWAIKYAELALSIPLEQPPRALQLNPYWGKNQCKLYQYTKKVCPVAFKEDIDKEIYYLTHLVRVSGGKNQRAIDKMGALCNFFFYSDKIREFLQITNAITEDLEQKGYFKELKDSISTPFSDAFEKKFSFIGFPSEQDLIEQFKVQISEYEKLKGRKWNWEVKKKKNLKKKLRKQAKQTDSVVQDESTTEASKETNDSNQKIEQE